MSSGWRTLRELDESAGTPKGTAFRAFKRIEPTLREPLDYRLSAVAAHAAGVIACRRNGAAHAISELKRVSLVGNGVHGGPSLHIVWAIDEALVSAIVCRGHPINSPRTVVSKQLNRADGLVRGRRTGDACLRAQVVVVTDVRGEAVGVSDGGGEGERRERARGVEVGSVGGEGVGVADGVHKLMESGLRFCDSLSFDAPVLLNDLRH